MLSKTASQYPEVGDVRVIAILPALTKLYEVFLQRELQKNIDQAHPLHPNQRGFVKNGSCQKNIADLIKFVEKAQNEMKALITAKVPLERRVRTYLVYIDLRKAFDGVDRAKLVETMECKGFDPSIVKAYKRFCDDMKLKLSSGAEVVTNVGVVQGGVTSPSSFAIMMDPMLRALNEVCPTLALADDLVSICRGEDQLRELLRSLE